MFSLRGHGQVRRVRGEGARQRALGVCARHLQVQRPVGGQEQAPMRAQGGAMQVGC